MKSSSAPSVSRPTGSAVAGGVAELAEPARRDPARQARLARAAAAIAFAALLLAAGWLRTVNLNWDGYQHAHPDERFIVWVVDTMRFAGDSATLLDPVRSAYNPFRWPEGVGEYVGQPRGYAYGHFPLYLLMLAGRGAAALATALPQLSLPPPLLGGAVLAEYEGLPLVGRALSALFDLGVLVLVFVFARRLYGSLAGWLAAASYAVAVLPVQQSHFYTVDPPLTFFVLAAVLLAARHAEDGKSASWVGAALFTGLAIGTKASAAMLLLPLFVAALLVAPPGSRRGRALAVGGKMVDAVLVAFLAFALTNPYALLDAGQFMVNLTQQNSMVNGTADVPYTRQYIGTLPYAYFVRQLAQWGLGWLLGFAAWGGLMWAVAAAVRRVAGRGHLVALAWALPYFAVTGLFHAKFLRYMLPLLPFLLIFAAGGAVALLGLMRTRRARAVWAGGVTVVLASAVLWCLAFTGGVYRQEHPWLQASRWIYENIPANSTLVSEQWDDALPLGLSELRGAPPPHTYLGVELKLFDRESQAKLDQMSAALSGADYVVLATDRLSTTIGRLPERYPMTSQYYRMLDSGELGYRLVAEFATYPALGGLTIRDGSADESFRVYDHPRVRIYANEARLTESVLHTRLGRYLPLGAPQVSLGAGQGGRAPGKALELHPQDDGGDHRLMLGQSPSTLPVVDDFRWNTAAAGSPALALLAWWLAVSLFGWAAWPLLFPLLGGLRDRGLGIARQLGWLIVGYVFWMGASLGVWENRLPVLAGLVGLLALAGALAGFRQRREIASFVREHRRLVLGEELLFAGALAAFTGVRMLNPDLWQPWFGGEKFMEFAFLNAILRSPTFPPYDPYFAGGTINYYYYGLYLVSLPIKLTGVPPEVSFNLAVPALFAVAALAVFSLGYTMAQGRGRAASAALSVSFALVLGNLEGFSQLLRVLRDRKTPLFSHYDYWAVSRVIPQTINEFPYWTFLFADLHPHMIAMPFGLAVAGLALNWLRGKGKPATLVLVVVALGALGPANTWDLPVYGLLLFAAFLLAAWRARRRPTALRFGGHRWPLVEAVLLAGAATGLSVVAYFPFFARYQTMVGAGDGGVLGRYLGIAPHGSPLGDWLITWGGLLILPAGYLCWAVWREQRNAGGEGAGGLRGGRRGWTLLLLVLVGMALLLAVAGRPAAAIALPMSALFAVLLFRPDTSTGEVFTCLLAALGLAILGGIELVYLRDFLDGSDWMRMNTVFKFSVPAWLFLGAANGAILGAMWPYAARSRSAIAGTWQVLAATMVIMGLAFLVPGTGARVNDRFPGQRPARNTLDGMAFMTVGEYTWPDPSHTIELRHDYAAVRWLLENAHGAAVVAEAPAGDYFVNGEELSYDYYRAGGLRAASLTGLATFVGHHQLEQRPSFQVLIQAEEGQELFSTPDLDRTRQLLEGYDVRYIYVGALERYLFPAEGLAKFDELVADGDLRVAYRNEVVTIYAREH